MEATNACLIRAVRAVLEARLDRVLPFFFVLDELAVLDGLVVLDELVLFLPLVAAEVLACPAVFFGAGALSAAVCPAMG